MKDWLELILFIATAFLLAIAAGVMIAWYVYPGTANAAEARKHVSTEPCDLVLESRPAPLLRLTPQDVLDMSRTIFAESRSEPLCAQVAVGFVIINRMVLDPKTWGSSPSAVSRRRYQFSVWNTPEQRAKLEALDQSDPAFLVAKLAAHLALTGAVEDPSGGSTHFTTASMKPPAWTKGMTRRRIGNQIFYKGAK